MCGPRGLRPVSVPLAHNRAWLPMRVHRWLRGALGAFLLVFASFLTIAVPIAGIQDLKVAVGGAALLAVGALVLGWIWNESEARAVRARQAWIRRRDIRRHGKRERRLRPPSK